LSDSIITDLSQSRLINVLSTDQLLGILRRLGLLEARAYASDDVKSVAAEGRVNHVLQGSLSKAGDLFRIDYTLQEVGSGKTVGSSRVEGKGEVSMFAMVDELTRRIKSDLKLSAGEIAGDFDKFIGQITTSSPEAYKIYIEGVRLHHLGENRKAIEYYEKAVAIDPEFASAYRSMGTAYNNLGYSVKSREFRKKAFELSDRVSDRERYRNQAEFYGLSDRTLDKEIAAFSNFWRSIPMTGVQNTT
jgi:TolB-like protein